MRRDRFASIVVTAEALAVGDVLLPAGRRYHAAGVLFVAPEFPHGVRVVSVGDRRVERVVKRRTRFRIATRLPAAGGMSLYRRAVGRRLVAWYPTFTGSQS